MESLYFLVPVALVFLVLAIRLLFWAVNSGQYDDLDTEGQRILFDEKPANSAATRPRASTPAGSAQEKPQETSSAAGKAEAERSAPKSSAPEKAEPNRAEPEKAAAEQATAINPGSDGRRDER